MSENKISRRRFLKIGCLTTAAIGVAGCGGLGLASALTPELPPIDLPGKSFGPGQAGKRILIAYASMTGATVQVADVIGQVLGERGFGVDVKPVKDKPVTAGYQAVIIGSAVQYGGWLAEALTYVKDNQQALNSLPTAVFSVHITNLGADAESRRKRLAYIDPVRALIKLSGEGFFPGRFDSRGAEKLLPRFIAHLIPAFDLFDWPLVKNWAGGVKLG